MTTWQLSDLYPKYWLTWLALGILYIISHLPYRWQLSIGRSIGWLMYQLLKRRRQITAINIKLCFPHLSQNEQQALVKKTFASVGIAIMETAMAWWWPVNKLTSFYTIEGLETAQQILAQGRGLLLIGAHYTTLDICGRMTGLTHQYDVTYREQNNRIIDKLLRKKRERDGIGIIHRHDIRHMIRRLKQGNPVWYAPDQDYGRKHSVFAPFFGVQAATISTPARIAKLSGAAVCIISHFRQPDNSGYHIIIHPPLAAFPTGDDTADATLINQHITTEISKHPEQYLWLHRRFKTRLTGEKKIY